MFSPNHLLSYKFSYSIVYISLIILLAMNTTQAQSGSQLKKSLEQKLNKNIWQKRVLLVIASSKNDQNFIQQQTILKEPKTGVADRDLEVIYVFLEESLQTDKDFIKQKFDIQKADFYTILIGKDGGEKLRSQTPLEAERLFETIDAMPIRRQEMRSKNK